MAVSIIAAALAAGTAIYGGIQANKARKAAAANIRPTYQIPQTEWDNLSLLGSQASNGMSDASRQLYTNNADRGLATSIGAQERGGGDPNAMSGVYDQYANSIGNLAIADDARHSQNLQNLIAGRQRMSNFTDKKWQVNDYAPWADRAKAFAEQEKAGNATMWSGINSFGGALGNFASGMKSNNMGNTSAGDGGAGGGGGNGGGGAPAGVFGPGAGGMGGGVIAPAPNTGGGSSYLGGPDYEQMNGMDPAAKHAQYNNWLQYQNVA